jgi:hypothetical protein
MDSRGGCAEPDSNTDLEFDVVRVQLMKTGADDVFAGTTKVVVTVEDQDCLSSFYADESPELAQTGDDGSAIFDEWTGRLCDPTESFAKGKTMVDCNIESIEQTIEGMGGINTLSVTYEIEDADMNMRMLAFGPLPTEELAGCTPQIRLAIEGAEGYGDDGIRIWKPESYGNGGRAAAGQGAPLAITVAR